MTLMSLLLLVLLTKTPRTRSSFTLDSVNQAELTRSPTSRASGEKKTWARRVEISLYSDVYVAGNGSAVLSVLCATVGGIARTRLAGGYSRFHGPINHRSQLLSLSALSLSLSLSGSREAVLFKSQKLENTCPENLANP